MLAISNFAKGSIRFFSFEAYRSLLLSKLGFQGQKNNTSVNVLSGLLAGATESILVVTPGEALKTKFIHDASRPVPRFKNLGLGPAAVLIVREEEVRAL